MLSLGISFYTFSTFIVYVFLASIVYSLDRVAQNNVSVYAII